MPVLRHNREKLEFFFERLYVRAFLSNSRFENYRNIFATFFPMRKGAANSKHMCIICHYLIAQNGNTCTSFFDTLVGSVNNNAHDQVRSICPIHFLLDHSSDKLISFLTRNSILLLVQLTIFFFPKIRSQVWGAAYMRVQPIRR